VVLSIAINQLTTNTATVAVVNENRSLTRQHIVRVLRGPSLSAYSQISGGFGSV
jgi:hypothetical protein